MSARDKTTWGAARRYLTDDRDGFGSGDRGLYELVVAPPDGNGDWYVSVLPEGHKIGPTVRITTSGQKRPGLVVAMAQLFRALGDAEELEAAPAVVPRAEAVAELVRVAKLFVAIDGPAQIMLGPALAALEGPEPEDDPCPGAGKCHGPLSWCATCDDHGTACDAGDDCDRHRPFREFELEEDITNQLAWTVEPRGLTATVLFRRIEDAHGNGGHWPKFERGDVVKALQVLLAHGRIKVEPEGAELAAVGPNEARVRLAARSEWRTTP